MTSREDVWKQYVEAYELDVPEELVENELQYIIAEMRHRMQYDTLTGGQPHLFVEMELEQQMDDMRAAALYEAKSDLVMKELLNRHGFTATKEELEAEAAAMAERQSTTVDMIKGFFGEDLAMLERDVKERKAMDWVWEQTSK